MYRYIFQRVLIALPVLAGILFVTFALARLIPGDPCRAVLGERATAAICDAFMKRHGLDRPIPEQFLVYVKEIARGDLGDSLHLARPVTQILIERLPVTFELSLFAMLVSTLIGIPLGVISAVRHNSLTDVLTMLGANIGVSMPVFWLGLMLAYLFSILLKGTPLWLPPSGRLTSGIDIAPLYVTWKMAVGGNAKAMLDILSNMHTLNALLTANWVVLGDAVRHLILPAMALGTIPMSIVARITRSSMLEVLGQDYVRTAWAKGATPWRAIMKHAFRNALLPVVTVIGLSFGGLLSGAVLTETIFSLPGMGRMLYESITARDYVVIQGFTLMVAVAFVVINLLTDLTYSLLDPRIRLS